MLLLAVAALLLSGCSQVRTTSPVEPVSREYKLLLDPARFDNTRINATIGELDRLAREAALASGVAYEGSLVPFRATREVAFLDVPGQCSLRQRDLVLRLRSKKKKTTATLKYRTPLPAAIAGASNPWQQNASEIPVEVDITPPYDPVWSQSLSRKVRPGGLKNLRDLHALFPAASSLAETQETRLAIVGNSPIREEVRGKALLDLGSNGNMSLSLWYRADGDARPVIAELSFKYERGKQDTSDEKRARKLFEALQQLEGWISPRSMTKTAFIYASSTGFCEQE